MSETATQLVSYSASDSFTIMALYKFTYLLTYITVWLIADSSFCL